MITLTDTPNPESKKFIFDFDIVKSGSKEIKSIEDCKKARKKKQAPEKEDDE